MTLRVFPQNIPLPRNPESQYDRDLQRMLNELLRSMGSTLNELQTNPGAATASAAPTTGNYLQGDYVWNNAFAELGLVGMKYIVRGWACTASGAPGTWVEDRGLTGN